MSSTENVFDHLTESIDSPENQEEKPKQIGYDRSKDTFLRNLGAGLTTDFLAAFPSLLGIGGSLGEASYRTATDDASEEEKAKQYPLQRFKKHFEDSVQSGFDRDLLESGVATRMFGRNLLGLPEFSRSREGQLGEIAGMVGLPVPGSILGKMAGNVGGRVAALATPLVRIEGGAKGLVPKVLGGSGDFAGNIGRYGTQTGIATGIDQTIRSVADEPTLVDPDKSPFDALTTPVDPNAPPEPVGNVFDHLVESPDRMLRDQKIQDEQITRYGTWAAGAVILTAVALAAKGRLKAMDNFLPDNRNPAGISETPSTKLRSFKGAAADRDEYIKQLARDVLDPQGNRVWSEDQIDELVSQFSSDSYGQLQKILETGDTGLDSGLKIPSLQKWTAATDELGVQGQKDLFMGMLAMSEKTRRARATLAKEMTGIEDIGLDLRRTLDDGTTNEVLDALRTIQGKDVPDLHVTPGFYKNAHKGAKGKESPYTIKELDEMEAKVKDGGRLEALVRQYDEMTEGALEYAVQRNIITKAQKDVWRNIWMKDGLSTYVPGIDASIKGTHNTMLGRLGTYLGLNTSKANEIFGVASFRSSIAETGSGTKTPINPAEAFAYSMHSIIDHANRSNAQQNILARMTGVLRNSGDDTGKMKLDAKGKPLKNEFGIEYIGMNDPSQEAKTIQQIIKEHNPHSKTLGKRFNTETTANTFEKSDQIIKTQEKGKEFLYHVSDKVMYDALMAGPRELSMLNKAARAFKNTFQMTTTRMPPFLPISWGYATQQAWMNSVARGVSYTPFTAFNGTFKLLAASLAEESSMHIMKSLATNSGVFSMLPRAATQAMQKRLAKAAENTLMHGVKTKTGHLSPAISESDIRPNVIDIMKDVYPMGAPPSVLGQAWRYYEKIVRAVGEGPGYGAMLKKQGGRALQDLTSADYRSIRKFGADVAGDVRRLGGSKVAETFNSWVPFSGPMVQEWNSAFSALNYAAKNGKHFHIMAYASIPMIPAIMEAIQTSLMGEEYRDYYWNTLDTTKRNNWVHIFRPGRPPEEAIVLPVSPYLSFFRAFGIEAVDALLGLSTEVLPHKGQFGNGSHMLAALTRLLDIPVPPAIKAAFATMGYNLQIGPKFSEKEMLPSFGEVRPLGGEERISGMRGRSRYVDPVINKEAEGFLQSLLGGAAALGINMFQGLRTGTSSKIHDQEPNVLDRVKGGWEGLVDGAFEGLSKQAKYVPVIGGTMRHTAFDEISDQVMSMQQGFDTINNLQKVSLSTTPAGSMRSLENTYPLPGQPLPLTTDPIMEIAMETIDSYRQTITEVKKRVSNNRAAISSLRSSPTFKDPVTNETIKIRDFTHRNELLDMYSMYTKKAYLEHRYALQNLEDEINERARQELRREVNFDLSDVKPRPEAGFGGPISSFFPKPR